MKTTILFLSTLALGLNCCWADGEKRISDAKSLVSLVCPNNWSVTPGGAERGDDEKHISGIRLTAPDNSSVLLRVFDKDHFEGKDNGPELIIAPMMRDMARAADALAVRERSPTKLGALEATSLHIVAYLNKTFLESGLIAAENKTHVFVIQTGYKVENALTRIPEIKRIVASFRVQRNE